jgi:hypothetical protein
MPSQKLDPRVLVRRLDAVPDISSQRLMDCYKATVRVEDSTA